MAKSKRDFMKRRLGYILVNLDRVMDHGLRLVGEFNAVIGLDTSSDDYDTRLAELAKTNKHARYAQLLQMALYMTLQAQRTFEDFAKHAWGGVPDKIDRWTNTGQDYRKAKDK